MQFNRTLRAERFALELSWDQLPAHVQEQARLCGMDLMCALILGSQSKQFASGARLAQSLGLSGTIPIVGCADTFNLLGATMVMGHGSNAFDIDDGFNLIKGHPGTSFVAGAMAASLQKDTSYAEYLTTLVACYEITIRWALAMQDYYGFLHSTGAYGAFGTALAIGRSLDFSPEKMNNALSMADFHAPLTPVMHAVEYPSMNKDGVPFGALVGAMAALETEYGINAKTHLLELPDYAHLLDSLGEHWYLMELYFKPYTCCRWAHQPISACLALMSENDFDYTAIEHVEVHTFEAAARLSKEVPHCTDEAQYNIAYPIAAALVHGDVTIEQINDDALGDERVLSMMQNLSFVVDEKLESLFPEQRLAWVRIQLSDGRTVESDVFAAPGEAGDGTVDAEWIHNKFVRHTKSVLDPETQVKLTDMLYEEQISLREIVSTINRALV